MRQVPRTARMLPLIAALALSTAPVAAAEVEEILVEGQRSLAPDFSVVGNLTTLDEDVIATIAAVHPHDAFVRVPGVWVSKGSGQEHLTAIRSAVLTGSGACGSFLFMENGLSVRPVGFCNVNNLFEVNVEQAGAVEVVRGPASALYGGNAVHGVINVLSPAPVGRDGGSLRLEAGPWDFLRGDVDLEGAVLGGRARAAFTGTTTDGWRDDTGYDQQKLVLTLDRGLGTWDSRTVLSATNLNQETGGFVLGEDAYADGTLRDTNPNPEAFRDAWAVRLSTDLQRDLGDGASLMLKPYARLSDMDFLQHFLPGQPLEENGHWSVGTLARWQGGGPALDWSVGGQLEFADTWLKETQDGPTQGSPFLVETRPEGKHYDYEVESLLLAGFYDLAWRVSPRVTLVHSLRGEWLRYDYDNDMLDGNTRDDGSVCGFGGCLYTRPADRDDDFGNLAGRLGVEWALNDRAAAWLAAGIGFRAPQMTELYRLQRGQTVADLDSESLRSLEAGLKWADALVDASLTAYIEHKEDVIFRDASGFNVSDGKTDALGVEFALTWTPTPRHSFDLVGTWADHEYDFSGGAGGGEVITEGNQVDTAPQWQGSAHWRALLTEALRFELEAVYMDDYYLDAANAHEYEGHALLNLRLFYMPAPNTEIAVRLLNLTDERYADRADFAFGNYRYFPGEPRRAYVALKYSF